MQALILAAGRGERLMPLTKNTPKPLIKVQGKALIEHTINWLQLAGINDIIINTSYLAEQITQHLKRKNNLKAQLKFSFEPVPLETAGGIINALQYLNNKPFVVINADVFCNYDLTQLHLPQNSLAHLVLVNNPTHHLTGDFGLDKHRIILKSTPYTFAGIGLYHPLKKSG
jgi:MurNAc alpha-1-phosphate uridylyltransferase